MSTINTSEIISLGEAAEIIGVSKRRVLQYCQQGRLGEFVAGRYLITKKEAKAFQPKPHGRPPQHS